MLWNGLVLFSGVHCEDFSDCSLVGTGSSVPGVYSPSRVPTLNGLIASYSQIKMEYHGRPKHSTLRLLQFNSVCVNDACQLFHTFL